MDNKGQLKVTCRGPFKHHSLPLFVGQKITQIKGKTRRKSKEPAER